MEEKSPIKITDCINTDVVTVISNNPNFDLFNTKDEPFAIVKGKLKHAEAVPEHLDVKCKYYIDDQGAESILSFGLLNVVKVIKASDFEHIAPHIREIILYHNHIIYLNLNPK